jgi:hypothetical protein
MRLHRLTLKSLFLAAAMLAVGVGATVVATTPASAGIKVPQ